MEAIVKGMLKDIIENPVYDEKLIHRYFTDNYTQTVDHSTLDLPHFKQHIIKLKDLIKHVHVEVINCAGNSNTVFTKHHVYSVLRDGTANTHKVLAEFKIRHGKIACCDELTFLISGSESGKDLGSVL
ncbi:hypothetical protein ED312_22365 [Sinomicrobium pectinilyticum]|uniref:Nuclear transport factor 2 family protein n=1 Tax=Sinomicrobium pectinilyticum TaxID=1084421 RepID=A0A3N0D0T9_SINP1|nr:hypothetical protein [Sinomicrobium pectinilyticum]RNL69275.1 hypothetical protein ED312_22365 [Sinomicrobium pectinilyticum]